jgi:hypothetical protein
MIGFFGRFGFQSIADQNKTLLYSKEKQETTFEISD